MEGWVQASALSPENRGVAEKGRTLPPYVFWGCVTAAAAPRRCSATAGDAAQTQRSPWRTHPESRGRLKYGWGSPTKVLSGLINTWEMYSRYLTVLFDWTLEVYRFGGGDDCFETNLLLFPSIQMKAEVWALVRKGDVVQSMYTAAKVLYSVLYLAQKNSKNSFSQTTGALMRPHWPTCWSKCNSEWIKCHHNVTLRWKWTQINSKNLIKAVES